MLTIEDQLGAALAIAPHQRAPEREARQVAGDQQRPLELGKRQMPATDQPGGVSRNDRSGARRHAIDIDRLDEAIDRDEP